MLPDHIDQTLRLIYYDPKSEGGFASIDKLYAAAKLKDPHVTRTEVRNWLASELTYSLHAPTQTNFSRNRCVVEHVDEQWQADLVDMASVKRNNNNVSFILTVIDMFSKFAFTIPLKNKSGQSLKKAFQQIFSKGRIPMKLQTDKGTEFTNRLLQDYLAKNNVHFFTTTNVNIKCSVIERFNRTLKMKMYKYLTAKSTKKYIDVLDSLTDSYNRSKHRTTKMRPIDVDPDDLGDEKIVFRNTYRAPSKLELLRQSVGRKNEFEIGDEVRIALVKKTFSKGYKQQWSKDTYKVVNCIHRIDRNVYEIANSSRRVLRKKFYPEELSKVTVNLSHINNVIRSRENNGAKECLVRVVDSIGERNRWVPEDDVPHALRKV
jgi:hypothetical protein